MKPKSPLELHREFYERRQREIEARRPAGERDQAEQRVPQTNGAEGRAEPVHRNGHRRQ